MATQPSEFLPVTGRVDAAGRLVAADPPLAALQVEAGSALGRLLALPQIAAIARLAAQLQTPVSRPAIAASADRDLDLWVRATPRGDGVDLTIESWVERPAAGPRLDALVAGGSGGGDAVDMAASAWSVNDELQIVSLSAELARMLEVDPDEVAGQPLTRLLRLEEDEEGEMPLLAALGARRSFTGQQARPRKAETPLILLSGEVVLSPAGAFAGFKGSASVEGASPLRQGRVSFDEILDEALRSPLDRIVEQAEWIVRQADGPLQADYAAYGNDIAAAARHLLSVIRTMNAAPSEADDTLDLAALSEEAAVMLESAAGERRVSIQIETSRRLPARGDERAVIQILVNLVGNAIRHSPPGGFVTLRFNRLEGFSAVTVEDQGPGISAGDEHRIFERFERATDDQSGTGLGLAISRRLARSMGGDVALESGTGAGARFSLKLPSA